jgi:hypothetical protein
MRTLDRVLDLLEVAVDHLGGIRSALDQQPLRGLGPEDLLTRDEVARYVRIQTAEVGRWLDDDGHGHPRVPRALSPGKARIPLYRVADVRRALAEDRSTAAEQSARARLTGRR